MKADSTRDLQALLHPYLFVLKEGKDIKDNLMDYSLLMLRVNATEVINSPGTPSRQLYIPRNLQLPLSKSEPNQNSMDI